MELVTLTPLWWLLLLLPWAVSFAFSLVDAPRWKQWLSWLLRVVGLLLLVIALCRPFVFTASRELHVLFFVDVSRSVSVGAARASADEIRTAINGLAPADSWSLFAVANGMREFDSPEALARWIDSWKNTGTDDRLLGESRLAESMLRGRTRFPADRVKRLVLLSDGQETAASLDDALRQLDEEGIEVQFRKLATLDHPEAAVVKLESSTDHAWLGEVVRMTVSVHSNRAGSARLRMLHRGVAVQEQVVELQPEIANRFQFDVDMVTPGAGQWTAELIPQADHFPVNNQLTCTVTVRGQPRILMLHQQEQELRPFVRALEEQGLSVEVRGRFGVPESIADLLAFDAVMLVDLPATAMTQRQMQLLQQYVEDFGGGLAMIGSENSFGLGGYHRTPVEEVLPLVSRYEKEQEKPSLAMVLVIDKSGSMEGLPMMLAREAAKLAVEVLSPRDQIGVVGFDGEPVIVSELRMAADAGAIHDSIDQLEAGGGTNLFPAMLVARDMLENCQARIRHMICLSDGQTEAADHESLAQTLADNGITVSTVALGEADRALMARIAELGRGRYYETNDPANVPQIFTSETMQASRSAIREDLFGTVAIADHPILTGFREADLPFTLGYVMTQARPAAEVLLVTEPGDPLLAVGRFGLGSGLAWTSDLSERWSSEWLAWNDCGRFWAQVLRGIIRQRTGEGIRIGSQQTADRWELDIRKTDLAGMPQSAVDWELATIGQDGQMETVPVRETGLGRYAAGIPVGGRDSLSLRLRDRDSDQMQVLHFNRPWPAEYNLSRKLSESLGTLPEFSPANVRANLVAQPSRVPVAHWFYFSALAAILVSSLVRRI